jgi:hypothetical protein
VNLPSEPDMKRSALEMFKNHQVQFAIEQANQCDLGLRCSIEEVNDTLEAPYFIGLQNFRHKVSHSLSKTRLEQRRDIAIPVKYGFETELLSTSTKLIEQFYSWINGISFSIEDDCRDFAKKCAEDLWHNCHFTIER